MSKNGKADTKQPDFQPAHVLERHLKPLHDQVVLRPIKMSPSAGAIQLSENAAMSMQNRYCEVIAVGPGYRLFSPVRVGEKVIYHQSLSVTRGQVVSMSNRPPEDPTLMFIEEFPDEELLAVAEKEIVAIHPLIKADELRKVRNEEFAAAKASADANLLLPTGTK